jgi:hypothetical protein
LRGAAVIPAALLEAELVEAELVKAAFVAAAFTGNAVVEGVFVEDVSSNDVFSAPCCPIILMRTSTAACGATDSRSGCSTDPAEAACGRLALVATEPAVVTGRRIGTVTTGTVTAAGIAVGADPELDCAATGVARLARIGVEAGCSAVFPAACGASESIAGVSSEASKSSTELLC